MNNELQSKLYTTYPKLFAQKDLSAIDTCMCWGIDCNDGWYFILDSLCNGIQSYINLNNTRQIEFVQVKQKFGSLRVYTDGHDELIDGMIYFAEYLSFHVCETCGSSKNVGHTMGWVEAICDACALTQNKKVRHE